MGLLDTLRFWRRREPDPGYGVEGCFTLPGTGPAEGDGPSTAGDEATDRPRLDRAPETS